MRLALTILAFIVWFIIYFYVNRLKIDPQRLRDFSISIDRKIPYIPVFALVYFSTVPFLFASFLFLSDARQFCWLVICYVTVTVISSIINVVFPSKIERVEQVTAGGLQGFLLRHFQKNFHPYGNFPSQHVSLAVTAVIAYYLGCGVTIGTIAAAWAIFITLSTFFAKQHYIMDAFAGLAVGLLSAGLLYPLIVR